MKIAGSYRFEAPREQVWDALLDRLALAAAIPGCERLDPAGDGEYTATMTVGISSFKGTYEGKVRLEDVAPPESYTLVVEGSGRPGFIRGTGRLSLTSEDAGTRVAVDGDVQVGGPALSVASRLVVPTAKMLMNRFFAAMQQEVQRRTPA